MNECVTGIVEGVGREEPFSSGQKPANIPDSSSMGTEEGSRLSKKVYVGDLNRDRNGEGLQGGPSRPVCPGPSLAVSLLIASFASL